LIWLSGLLLFCECPIEHREHALLKSLALTTMLVQTSLVSVYDTVESFNASAGIGPFNASHVDGFLRALSDTAPDYPLNILPYTYYGIVYNLLANPLFTTAVDPIRCSKSDENLSCQAHLLSGGLSMVTPFNPGGHRDYNLVRVPETPTTQLDSSGRQRLPQKFLDSDCDVFGSNDTLIAVKFCLSRLPDHTLQAGVFICEGITSAGACISKNPHQNVTTTVSFYKRTATMLTSRTNLTIVEISGLSEPEKVAFSDRDLNGYRASLAWLLDYSKAGIPGPSSIIEGFWSSRDKLADSTVDGAFLQNLHSILAFPVWLFNANNWGNVGLQGDKLSAYVPEEFYKTASVVKSYVKLRFDPAMLVVFIVFQGGVLVLLWGLWIWIAVRLRKLPTVSSFPLFDFAFKPEVVMEEVEEGRLWGAGDEQVLEIVEGARVMVRRSELESKGSSC